MLVYQANTCINVKIYLQPPKRQKKKKKNNPEKWHLQINTQHTDDLRIETNSVYPEQTVPKGAVRSGHTLFDKETSKVFSR